MKNTPSTQPQNPIKSYIPDFLEYLTSEKNLSSSTRESYSYHLKDFSKWLTKNNMKQLKPEDLTIQEVSTYKDYLANYVSPKTNDTLAQGTQHARLITLKSFLKFLRLRDIKSLDPEEVELPKRNYLKKDNIDKILTSTKIPELLSASNVNTESGLRNRAILELLFSTGLKAKQIVDLNISDLNFDSNSEHLEIKISNKDFAVQIPKKSAIWIRRYVNTREDNLNALFIRYKGPKSASRRLSKRSLENIIKKCAEQADVASPNPITPESLRNVYIKKLYNKKPPEIKNYYYNHDSINFEQNNFQDIFSIEPPKNKLPTSSSWNIIEKILTKK